MDCFGMAMKYDALIQSLRECQQRFDHHASAQSGFEDVTELLRLANENVKTAIERLESLQRRAIRHDTNP
jgi:hypothetical protein